MTTAAQLATYASNNSPFRNRIINGDMRIDQRNAGASVTPTASAYTLDRWSFGISQASKASIQQSATAPNGFVNSLVATSLSAYSVVASDLFVIQQLIEGNNIADLGWGTANAQTVTLSFWVRSSLTGTFGGALNNSGASRSYPFTYTISVANTWEQKTVTIAGDTSGTWLTTNSLGIGVRFGVGVGSTYSSTAGSWASGTYYSATGATSVVGTNGATFYITGVQLEKGSVATPFEYRPYGTELALCQRYYCKTFSQGTTPADGLGQGGTIFSNCGSGTGAGVGYITSWRFPVEMRIGPTVTLYTPSTASASSSWFLNNASTVSAGVGNQGTSACVVYNAGTATSGTNAGIHATASAEL